MAKAGSRAAPWILATSARMTVGVEETFAGFAGVAKVSLYRDPKKIAYLNGQFDIEHSE